MSSLAAPKSTYQESVNQEPTNLGAAAEGVTEKTAGDAIADAETIDASTGEIIVLAQRAPRAVAAEEQVTVLAKPEKRKSARQKASEKFAKATPAEDGTTPDMTATAKSDAGAPSGAGSGAKSEEVLAANAARNERKAAEKTKAKVKAEAKAGAKAGAKSGAKSGTKASAKPGARAKVK